VAAQAGGDRAPRVRVAGADKDILAGDRSRLLDGAPGHFDRRPGDEQRVDAHERDGRGAVMDDARDRKQLFRSSLALALGESAWHLGTRSRRDIADAEADL